MGLPTWIDSVCYQTRQCFFSFFFLFWLEPAEHVWKQSKSVAEQNKWAEVVSAQFQRQNTTDPRTLTKRFHDALILNCVSGTWWNTIKTNVICFTFSLIYSVMTQNVFFFFINLQRHFEVRRLALYVHCLRKMSTLTCSRWPTPKTQRRRNASTIQRTRVIRSASICVNQWISAFEFDNEDQNRWQIWRRHVGKG